MDFFENPWIQNRWILVSCPDLTGHVFENRREKKSIAFFFMDSYGSIPWIFIERTQCHLVIHKDKVVLQ